MIAGTRRPSPCREATADDTNSPGPGSSPTPSPIPASSRWRRTGFRTCLPMEDTLHPVTLYAMNATPLLSSLLAALAEVKLEVVLIGNAAAAIQGAPVTTIDFDFMFCDTPTNLRKLKTVAKGLPAIVMRPYYPVSKLYRMVNDDTGLQADFMPVIHGVRSFEGLKSRATRHVVGGQPVLVASLDDIIKSKKAAGRDRDRAVIPVLEQTLRAIRRP